jgi:NAD(P)H-hydrate epimerase
MALLKLKLGIENFSKYHETMYLINEQWIKQHIIHRSLSGHKKTFGHVLIIAGSEGMAGAAILCAKAAIHSGCGMVTALLPSDAVNVLLAQCPEIMYINNPSIEGVDLKTFDAILIGPGIGFSETTISNLKYVLDNYDGSIVLDADALTIVANEKYKLKANQIVTPHPGEFSRLMGIEYNEDKREEQALLFIEKTTAVLVLKGAKTIVGSSSNKLMQNTSGNDGMATAGSGDVLAGIIVALCARGYTNFNAAAIGVYIHGLAGDIAILNISKSGLIASDIINILSKIRLLD